MSLLIEGSLAEGGRIADDVWTSVESVDALRDAPAGASLLVPHALWTAERTQLIAHGGLLGIRLEPDDDPVSIVDDLDRFSLIAVVFPKFTDGRGYSIARLLRDRYDYRGRLRAVGDVLRDQLFYMLRCGFDSFALKHQAQIEAALSAYHDFSEAYQTSVDRRAPLFARRAASALTAPAS